MTFFINFFLSLRQIQTYSKKRETKQILVQCFRNLKIKLV